MRRLRIEGVTGLLRKLRDRVSGALRGRGSPRARKAGLRIAFFTPALLLIMLFVAYPVLTAIGVSFFDGNGHFVGLGDEQQVLGGPDAINLNRFPRPPPYGPLAKNRCRHAVTLALRRFGSPGFCS